MSWWCKCIVWLETNLLNDTRSGDECDVCYSAGNVLIIANNWQALSVSDGYRYWYENIIIIDWCFILHAGSVTVPDI